VRAMEPLGLTRYSIVGSKLLCLREDFQVKEGVESAILARWQKLVRHGERGRGGEDVPVLGSTKEDP
jgi:hypothetical protein